MANKKNRKQSAFERLTSGKLNRRQRKDWELRLNSTTPQLEVIHADAAGIDIGNESHFAAVAPGKDPHPVREFGSWTGALHELAEWLQSCGVKTVAMQSTGVYWIALYDVLEKHGLEVFLVNARHTRNIPGRKSDVQECEWLRRLHSYGLLRNSFRPPEQIRALRTVWRLRDRHVKEAGRCVQHMQKALTEMNVQLANAISDLSGVSGQAILRAILDGERDPYKLAALRDRRIAASEEELARSLSTTSAAAPVYLSSDKVCRSSRPWSVPGRRTCCLNCGRPSRLTSFNNNSWPRATGSCRSIWQRCRRVPAPATTTRTGRRRPPTQVPRVNRKERKNEKIPDPAGMHRSRSIWPRN